MATIDRTKIAKPSPIVEDDQGQLRARQGISREVVSELSKIKGEPDWMAEKRLESLEIFERKPIPTWGPDLCGLNLDDLVLYSPPTAGRYNSWDEVPAEMKQTYEDLGIPQAEREHLAGVVGVWRQEPVYEGLKEEYAKQGILFCSMDTAITEYPELVAEVLHEQMRPAAGQQVLGPARRRLVGRSRSATSPRASSATCRCSPTSAWRAPARAPSSTP